MSEHRVAATFLVRNSLAEVWEQRNPTLLQGEFGLENDTFLIKIGDGVRDWEHLPYLNKLDASYFKRTSDGQLTFSDSFATQINNLIAAAGGDASIIITDDPTAATDPISYSYLQRFVANAIANAGHLKREIVQTLPTQNIDENTIYMMPNSGNTGYEEYMYINGAWDQVGDTGDHSGYELPIATSARLGGVKASNLPDHINVTNDGFMTLNEVSTSLLYVPTGDTLVLYGGTA